MKKPLWSILIIGLFFCLVSCVGIVTPQAGAQQAERVELISLSGDTEVLLEGEDEYSAAQEGMILEPGDKIRTAGSSSAELSFNEDDTNLLRLNENTEAQISLSENEKLIMTEGEIFSSISKLPSGSAFEIRTPTAVSGARGTDWVTKVTEEGTDVEALESTPYVRHFESDGALSKQMTPVNPGQMTTVKRFQRPMASRPITQARQQEWQQIKQQVRRNAGEAVIKRQQRQPFNRQDFLQKHKEQRGPNKSAGQDKSGVFISREGERNNAASGVLSSREGEKSPPKPQPGGQKQASHPDDRKPLSTEKKLKIENKKSAVGGKPQPRNAIAPKTSKGASRR